MFVDVLSVALVVAVLLCTGCALIARQFAREVHAEAEKLREMRGRVLSLEATAEVHERRIKSVNGALYRRTAGLPAAPADEFNDDPVETIEELRQRHFSEHGFAKGAR